MGVAVRGRDRSRRRARYSVLLITTALTAVGYAGHARAQGQPSVQAAAAQLDNFSIPPQPLAGALTLFGRQSGMQVSVDAGLVQGVSSHAVNGSMSPQQALDRLLGGTGITYQLTGSNTAMLEKLSANSTGTEINLPPVEVEAAANSGSLTSDPYAGMINPPTTVGGKTPLTQRQIPQTVTVIPQEQIQQQNMQTLNDAMRYTPGVSVAQDDSERTTFYSRGFPIQTWMLDGLPTTQNLTSAAPNLAMFDRVEVLQGPDGLTSGFGSEGGAINLVRKRAPDTLEANAEVQGGTYDDFGTTLDVGGPLNSSGTVRGRIVGNWQSQDLMWDTSWRHDKLIYGTLEADLTPTTLLRVGGSFSEMDQKASWTGIGTYNNPVNGEYQLFNGGAWSTFLGAPWNHNAYYDTTAFAELDQKFAAGWTGKLAFNYLGSRDSVLSEGPLQGIENGTNLLDIQADKYHESDNQESVDAFVAGPVQLFGRTHTLTFGASYQREDYRGTNYYCGSDDSSSGDKYCDSTMTLSELQSAPEPAFNGPTLDTTSSTNQYGLYGNARIRLADPLTLVFGARATWWNTATHNTPGDTLTSSDQISGKITPYAGLIYDLNRNYSVYFSYSNIFNPQTAINSQGSVLPPLEGVQYETGIKGDYFGGKLNTSLAVFQMVEENRALPDPRFPGEDYYIATGRARSRGVEITATGYVTPSWTIFGGYTYTDAEYLDASTNLNGVAFSSIAPKHLFKLWTEYQLPDDLNKFSVGGGIYASSGIWATDGEGGYLKQGGYATVNLQGAYQITPKLAASVNVTNLFNNHYLASLENPYAGFYGQPLQVVFTLRAHL